MIGNIKVDVVYFSKSSDFEMEFNLCGCCRMRLLTEKGDSTKKTFVENLAVAANRSRIIIACGPVEGEGNIIETTATAIKAPLIQVNNKDYGIVSETSAEIIAGALPLVSSSGVFGGCVIESGPQSIILITDDKAVRKNLMKNLIHPYIEEISILPIPEIEDSTAPTETEELAKEITEQLNEEEKAEEPEILEEKPEEIQETLSEPVLPEIKEEKAQEPGLTDENTAVQSVLPIFDQAEFEPVLAKLEEMEGGTAVKPEVKLPALSEVKEEKPKENDKKEFIMDKPEPEKEDKSPFITEEDEYDIEKNHIFEENNTDGFISLDAPEAAQKPQKKQGGKINVTILVICVILALCLVMTAVLLIGIPAYKNRDILEYIKEIFTQSQSAGTLFIK